MSSVRLYSIFLAVAWVVSLSCVAGALPATASGPPAVVISDVAGDATEDAKLRAAVYEILRQKGYQPAARIDTKQASRDLGMLRAGRVTSEMADLIRLRDSLKVALLVRVTTDVAGASEHRALILVVGPEVFTTRVDVGAGKFSEPVASELASRIPSLVSVAEPVADTAAPGRIIGGPYGRKLPTLEEEEAVSWDTVRGLDRYYGAGVLLTGLQIADVAFQDRQPLAPHSGAGVTDMYGFGGGPSVRFGGRALFVSDPKSGSSVVGGIRFGSGIDLNFQMAWEPDGYSYSTPSDPQIERELQAYLYVNVPAQVGFQLGFGSFTTSETWRGVIVGLAYSPTATVFVDISRTFQEAAELYWNFAGVELTVDMVNLNADRHEPEPQIRISAFVLPPVQAEQPAFAS